MNERVSKEESKERREIERNGSRYCFIVSEIEEMRWELQGCARSKSGRRILSGHCFFIVVVIYVKYARSNLRSSDSKIRVDGGSIITALQ